VPRPVVFAHRRALRQLERIFRSEISTARANEGAHDDLLAQLVAARGGDGAMLSDDEILDELLVFSVTGYETMAAALAWTWYLLALHPEAGAQVQREADAPPGRAFTEAVLSEALRLYPPTWIFVRMALGADRLPSGLTVPAGAKLYLSQYVIQRSPRYFAEPERFDPSRFEPQALRSLPEFAYFPFGGGARLCIGKRLALLEGTLALVSIAARHHLSLEDAVPVEPDPGVTLRPRGPLMMRVHSR
jgi:cytochrome P450